MKIFEKLGFRTAKPEKKEGESAEIVKRREILEKVFAVNPESQKTLDELIKSLGISRVDERITDVNFPSADRIASFRAKIEEGLRDETLDWTNEEFKKLGLRPATVCELLEFLSQNPSIIENNGKLYAIGSVLEEGDRKFCVKFVKKEGVPILSLEEMGFEPIDEGKNRYYAPWGLILAVQE